MGADATKNKSGFELVHEYLNVCNAAVEEHRHSLVYRPIIAAYDSVFGNRPVGIDIYDSDPDQIASTITIRLVNREFVPAPASDVHPSFHLKCGRHYMEDVVAHRGEYIRHPEKLDWDWLKSRIGMEPITGLRVARICVHLKSVGMRRRSRAQTCGRSRGELSNYREIFAGLTFPQS